jgi:secreted trypsin-like serine protease
MSRSHSLLLLFVLAVLATACGAAPEGEDLGTTSEAITNGDEDSDDPAVVALLVQGQVECTGVLVTKSIVVTAAHCVDPSPPDSVYFGAHPGAKGSGGTTIKVADAMAHPDFDEDSLENDIAVIALASKAPVAPMKIYADSFDDSFKTLDVRLVGFGATGQGDTGASLRKRSGDTKIDSWTDTTFKFHAQPSQTCNGDSGGPAFATVDGEEVVIGITSSGDSDCKSHATDTRIDAYADFIQGYAKKYSATTHPGGVQNSGCSSSPRAPTSSGFALFAAAALALAWKRRRAS